MTDDDAVLRQQLREWYLPAARLCQFGNYLNAFLPVLRQLVLYVERAYRINLVTEKINTERQLMTEGIHVKDTAPDRKLPRLIDIIHHLKPEVSQTMLHLNWVYCLVYREMNSPLIQNFPADSHFC